MTSESKACRSCKSEFTVTSEDFVLYKKLGVPAPTWCPACRLQRRFAWRNERSLHQRHCDLCAKSMLALYPAETRFPVYCNDCWYSDRWDPLSYGREYDVKRPFFEQLKQLQDVVPRLALEINNFQNCDFSNQIYNSKNCYLLVGSSECEDCYYGHRVMNSRDVLDSLLVKRSERCLHTVEIQDSYQVCYSRNVSNSSNLLFCSNVAGSHDCFMSSNLRQASYVFRNQPLSKEEYQERMQAIDLGSHVVLAQLSEEFTALQRAQVHRFADQISCEACTGSALANSTNCHHCFCSASLENCRYCLFVDNIKDSSDVNNGCCIGELLYEVSTTGVNAYNVKFSVDTWPNAKNVSYVDNCRNGVSDLFGCIALRSKQYCILNKQYTQEEYEQLVATIVRYMDEQPYTNEDGQVFGYGEFFPIEFSPFAYNQSAAQEYFPLTADEATSRGYRWSSAMRQAVTPDVPSADLSDHINDIDDSYLDRTMQCVHAQLQADGAVSAGCQEQCTLVYKLMPREMAMYKEFKVAVPRLCPNCRHAQRLQTLPPYQLWERACSCAGTQSTDGVHHNAVVHEHGERPCINQFTTSFAPDRPEIVYCEECYQKEVV